MSDRSMPRQAQRRYPPELKERADRLVFETAAEEGEWHGAVGKVSKQLGIGPESRSASGSTARRSSAAPGPASRPRSASA